MDKQNVEIINGVLVDWSKFKCKNRGRHLVNSRKAYIGLCELLYENNHILLSEYINNAIKVLIDFNCGHDAQWILPRNYKSGKGCLKCAVELRVKMKENIVKEKLINTINENGHVLLSEYVNNKTKVLIDYNCGHEPHWITPNNYKNGQRCPKCSGLGGQAKEDFLNMLEKNGHKLLSEYINNSTKVLIDFNCGHEPHWIQPSKYKMRRGCPLCKNKGESALYELLLDMRCEVERQKRYKDLRDERLLPYDFYLPGHNLLIELDGEHHYKPMPYITKNMTDSEKDMAELDALISFEDRQRKDRLKDEYAKKNNIPLLRIDYSDSKIELERWKELILNKIKEIEV